MIQRMRPHATGLVYIGLILVVGVVAMNTQNNLLFWTLGVLAAGLVLSLSLSALMLRGIRARRLDPQSGAVGEPLVVRYELRNRRRLLPVFNLHCEELPDVKRFRLTVRRGAEEVGIERQAKPWQELLEPAFAWVMHVAGRETTHAEAVYWPTQRGLVRFNRIRLWMTFPMGIIRRSTTVAQMHHTLVFPRLYMLRPELLDRFAPAGMIGMRMTQRSGSGEEYFGVREYREGDSLRHISWKRTARTDELVTIERSKPSPPKLRVAINLMRATEDLRMANDTRKAKREAEERAISLAASILYAADKSGYETGLSVLGYDMPKMPLRRSRWHLGRMLAALASIDLDVDRQAQSRGVLPSAERAAFVIVHPDRVDPGLARDDVWHLTAAQLESVTTGTLGWDPSQIRNVGDVVDAMITTTDAAQETAA